MPPKKSHHLDLGENHSRTDSTSRNTGISIQPIHTMPTMIGPKDAEEFKYRCKSIHPFTYRAFVYTGLIVDSRLDEEILKTKTTELVNAWPALGGHLCRAVS
jgi:hypothetical protein